MADQVSAWFRFHGTDKFGHGYGSAYARHVHDASVILELGVLRGASLRAWQDRWPQARVMGVDLKMPANAEGLEVHVGDATDPRTYDGWLPEAIDLIVDDASHDPAERVRAFGLLWQHVAPGGWYVFEDLDNERWSGTTKTLIKNLVWADDVVEVHTYGPKIAFVRKIATEDVNRNGFMPAWSGEEPA